MRGRLALLMVPVFAALAAPTAIAWPGGPAQPAVARALGANLSGLALDGDAGLWAVRDSGALLHLDRSGATWAVTAGGAGERSLRYPNGRGSPDAEAVTTAAGDDKGVYVAAERDNEAASVGRNSILRFEPSGSGPLTATREWKLDAIFGSTPANTGVESLSWIPDSVFVAMGLRDASGRTYSPADYPDHGGGLFVTAVESRGELAFVALRSDGQVSLIGQAKTSLDATMDVSWNAARQELWVVCDNRCEGRAAVLRAGAGTWDVAAVVRPPSGMEALNDEGFVIVGPCVDAAMVAVWSDDGATGGTALRQAPLSCAPLAPPNGGPVSSTLAPVLPTGAFTPTSTVPSSISPASTQPLSAPPPPAGDPAASSRSGRYGALGAGAAVVAAVGGVLALRARGNRRRHGAN